MTVDSSRDTPPTAAERERIEARLRRLDADEFAAVVADLWTARGFDVRREGETVTVTRRGVTRTLYPAPGGDISSEAARPVDAADLTTALRYAVPPATAAAVCDRHLGAPPAALALPLSVRVRRSAGPLSAATVVLTLALFVAFATVPTPTAPDGQTTTAGSAAPGLGAEGVTDLEALSLAHARTLSNRTYTIQYAYAAPAPWGDRTTRIRREATATVAPDRFVLSTRVGQDGVWTTNRTVYHDGSNWYVADHVSGAYRRVPEGVGALSFVGEPGALRRTLVPTYLSTPQTSVTRVDDGYRVVGRGLSDGVDAEGARNYTVRARVDGRGVVRSLAVSYLVPTAAGPEEVVVTADYDQVGSATVVAPAWYDRRFAAENASESVRGPASQSSDAVSVTAEDPAGGRSTSAPRPASTARPPPTRNAVDQSVLVTSHPAAVPPNTPPQIFAE